MTEKAKLFSAMHNFILAIEHNGSSWAADSWKGPNLTSRVLVFVPGPKVKTTCATCGFNVARRQQVASNDNHVRFLLEILRWN